MMDVPKHNSARIVRQALSFERPERLPIYDAFWPEFAERWRRENDLPDTTDIEDHYWMDLQVSVASEQLFPSRVGEVGRDGEYLLRNDGWGRVVRTKPGTYFSETVDRVFKVPSDLDRIEFEPASLDARYPGLVAASAKARRRDQAFFVKIGGVYIRSTFFRGQTEFLMDLAGDEPLARAIAEKMGDHLLTVGLESLRRTNAYDFGVWVFDDMCNHLGPMFSPRTFERVFLPVYRRIVSELKAAGAHWVFLHCDGNHLPLLDLVLEAGFDGINPVEYCAGLDAAELLDRYWGRLRLVGGACNVHILPEGDRETIQRHVESLVHAGRNGGLVIGTHSIGPDIPTENYELYRRIVMEQGAYATCHEAAGGSA